MDIVYSIIYFVYRIVFEIFLFSPTGLAETREISYRFEIAQNNGLISTANGDFIYAPGDFILTSLTDSSQQEVVLKNNFTKLYSVIPNQNIAKTKPNSLKFMKTNSAGFTFTSNGYKTYALGDYLVLDAHGDIQVIKPYEIMAQYELRPI